MPSDRAAGIRHDAHGRRTAVLPLESVHALHVALLEQFGDNAPDLLYRTGYEWALQEMPLLNRQLRDASGKGGDLWQMDAKFVLESWWLPLAEAGWGSSTFDGSSRSRGIIFVELQHSVVTPAFTGSDQPVCHLYAGLYAGALSFFERAERHATEIQCAASGAATCLFALGPGADIDAAETWRQQGVLAAEIIRRLR